MKFKVTLFVVVFAAALFAITGGSGLPQEAPFQPQPLDDLMEAAMALLVALTGIPAFLSALLAILEYFGKITEATSDAIQIYANSALYLAAFVAVALGKTQVLSMIDHYLGGFAPLLVAFLALLTGLAKSIISTRRYAQALRGLAPVKAQLRILSE